MSDRLALANAIEDTGIERAKAGRVASVIVDLVHDQVATKADLLAFGTSLRADMRDLRGDMQTLGTSLCAEIAKVGAKVDLLGQRLDAKADLVSRQLLTRLGALIVVAIGAAFAALHNWPPHP